MTISDMVRITMRARRLAMAACFVALSVVAVVAQADVHGQSQARPVLGVDVAAQSLDRALAEFDAQTGVSVFFPSELVAGRMAAAVRGRYRADEALRRLLAGSGLAARRVAPDAYVLAVDKPYKADEGLTRLAPQPPTRGYAGLLQARVHAALCASPQSRPGAYRLALRLGVGASGKVQQVRLLDTTGDAARDAAVVQALANLDVGQAPADPGKPFVLLVRPRAQGAPVCPNAP